MRLSFAFGLSLSMSLMFTACVMSGTHETALAAWDQTQKELDAERQALKDVQNKLDVSQKTLAQQKIMLASMSIDIEKLSGEKGKLDTAKAKLSGQVQKLKQMQAVTELRNAEFRKLVQKLKSMMDAGTLEVKPRNGLLIVQMSSDVVFPPGSTRIKEEAKDALAELAQTLASFEGRRFQVMGHSDNLPIRSPRFPSNWELSTARAVKVVKLLIEHGVDPTMINAAGNAEFDPLTDNDSRESREINRRVEIIFLPKIDELPGFDKVLKGS
jgi:chemotaxis protein MotB